ncbi:MAG: hypothetical protein ACREH8_02810 [Opitutaceae bacterium]
MTDLPHVFLRLTAEIDEIARVIRQAMGRPVATGAEMNRDGE